MSTLRTLQVVTDQIVVDKTLDKQAKEMNNLIDKSLDEHAEEMNNLKTQMINQSSLIKTLTHGAEINNKIHAIDAQLKASQDKMGKANESLRNIHSICKEILNAQEVLVKNTNEASRATNIAVTTKEKLSNLVKDLNNAATITNSLRTFPLPILSFIKPSFAEFETSLTELKKYMDNFALMAKTPSGIETQACHERIYNSFQESITKMKIQFEKISQDHIQVDTNCKKAKKAIAGIIAETKAALQKKMDSIKGGTTVFNRPAEPASPTVSPGLNSRSDSDSNSDSDTDENQTSPSSSPTLTNLHRRSM